MNWDAIGAIAELLGAIGVIVSLAYLAVQIRQNTVSVKAATELETGRLWSELHSRMANSPDMTSIWDKGLTDETTLTAHEKEKFIWFVAEYFFLVESLYRQWNMKYLSDQSWESHQKAALGMLQHPLIRRWFESGVSPYSETFHAYMLHMAEDADATKWSYTRLSDL